MTNWNIIQIVNMIVNRDINSMAFTPEEYQTMINAQSLKLFKTKLGSPEEYKGTPNGQQGVGYSKKIDRDLNPFLVYSTKAVAAGVLDLTTENPAYINAIIPVPMIGRGFDEITQDEIGDRTNNPITMPTLSDPVIFEAGANLFNVLPASITNVKVSYYKYPASATVSVTANVATLLPEYGAGNTELEWGDMNKVDIAYFIARDAGLNVERNDVVSVANQILHDK